MDAPIQMLRRHISRLRFLSFLSDRQSVTESQVALDKVAFSFKDCGDCVPTAEQLGSKERERAERFKGDQLLPIIGIGGPGPSCG